MFFRKQGENIWPSGWLSLGGGERERVVGGRGRGRLCCFESWFGPP